MTDKSIHAFWEWFAQELAIVAANSQDPILHELDDRLLIGERRR